MPFTDQQAVRATIQDFPTLVDRQIHGDGTASSFLLGHRAITSGSAFVPAGKTAWAGTGATFNESGMVSFARVIPNESAVRLTYVRSVFDDAEIEQFLSAGGSQKGAAKEAVIALMFDGVKRAAWAAPDGTQYDDTAVLAHLRSLYLTLDEAQAQDATAEGGVVEWSINQDCYT